MKHKVVYNACYGGFSLSDAAMDWLVKNAREEISQKARKYMEKKKASSYYDCSNFWHFDFEDRHDPDLVRCVEELGHKASGRMADLRIHELKGNKYRIDYYDGYEEVQEPDDIEFIEI